MPNQYSFPSIYERFWAKVNKNGPVPEHAPYLGPCWLWTAGRNYKGYGTFRIGGRMVYAHRYAYGLIPEGLECDHLCRVRSCVRRSHLELVTSLENIQRGETGQNHARKTHCPHDHPYSGGNLYMFRGGRYCRACSREKARRYRRQKRVAARGSA